MGVSILDGTIEEIELKRSFRNLRIFRHIRFRKRDGKPQTIVKAIVDAAVAQHLQPGVSGRFYLYTTLEQRGVHGLRSDGGASAFGFPRNNEVAILVLLLLNLLWVLTSIAVLDGLPVIGTLIVLLFGPYYLHLRQVRSAARRQFDGDAKPAPAPAAAAAQPLGDRFA